MALLKKLSAVIFLSLFAFVVFNIAAEGVDKCVSQNYNLTDDRILFPEVGDVAEDFTIYNYNTQSDWTLSDYIGKKIICLVSGSYC